MSNYKIKSVAKRELQIASLRWFSENYPEYGDLLIALPNGFRAQFDYKTNKNLKKLGFKDYTPDLFLAVKTSYYRGLFIELLPRGERLRKTKYEYLEKLRMNNYRVVIVRDLKAFKDIIKNYL
jgi:hypothetical protein